MKNNKSRAIERANKRLLEESKQINEGYDVYNGSPYVRTIKGGLKGKIVDLNYVINLENGKTVIMKYGEFYDDYDEHDLPF